MANGYVVDMTTDRVHDNATLSSVQLAHDPSLARVQDAVTVSTAEHFQKYHEPVGARNPLVVSPERIRELLVVVARTSSCAKDNDYLAAASLRELGVRWLPMQHPPPNLLAVAVSSDHGLFEKGGVSSGRGKKNSKLHTATIVVVGVTRDSTVVDHDCFADDRDERRSQRGIRSNSIPKGARDHNIPS